MVFVGAPAMAFADSSWLRRLGNRAAAEALEQIADVVHDLRGRERSDVQAAVRGGEGFETLWSRRTER